MPTHGTEPSTALDFPAPIAHGQEPETHQREAARRRRAALAENGRTLFYDARSALPALYRATDPQQARARLDEARTKEVERRLARDEAEIDARVEHIANGIAVTVRDRILGLTTALAPKLAPEMTVREAGAILNAAFHEMLHSIADYGEAETARLERQLGLPPLH